MPTRHLQLLHAPAPVPTPRTARHHGGSVVVAMVVVVVVAAVVWAVGRLPMPRCYTVLPLAVPVPVVSVAVAVVAVVERRSPTTRRSHPGAPRRRIGVTVPAHAATKVTLPTGTPCTRVGVRRGVVGTHTHTHATGG